MLQVQETEIKGVFLHRLVRHTDTRGWLAEIFREDELPNGITPKMAYVSVTKPGFVRGPHEHSHQTDFFVFPGISRFQIYLWDNREDSSTFRKMVILSAEEESALALIIPPGIVHAYKNVGTVEGVTINCPNKLYKGKGRQEPVDEIRYEDKLDSPFKI